MPNDPPSDSDRADLPASSEEIAKLLSYALRPDERGQPYQGGGPFAAEPLRQAGHAAMKARGARPHSTG